MWLKKLTVFSLSLLPLGWLFYLLGTGQLGPDPGKEIVLFTGIWALRFLVITLLISPVKRITGKSVFLRFRRMMGLFVWFYASVHFFAVLHWILGWSWAIFIEEFSERPYMAVGIIAYAFLLPLAITSNRWMIKKLGHYWKKLHKLVYLISVLVCMHFIWLIRSDYFEAVFYSFVIGVLLVDRLLLAVVARSRLKNMPASSAIN